MLEYERIDISEGIDFNKTDASKECDTGHYWYFKEIGFKYEPYLCNGCHCLIQKGMNFNYAAIGSIKGSDYRIYFWYMSKDDAINIMNTSGLNDKSGVLKFFLLYIKMSECNSIEKTYYQRNRDVILNRTKDYHKNDKIKIKRKCKR